MEITHLFSILGPTGFILGILFFICLYLTFRSGIYLYLVGKDFSSYFTSIQSDPTCATYCNADARNPLIAIVQDILSVYAHDPSIDIRTEIKYYFSRNFERTMRKLSYLRFISVVSPLLGLLGTMLGMVKVFQTIATEATPDSALLASGIWEALITTILGLCVAIPALASYYHLRLKLQALLIRAIEHSLRAIELCKKNNCLNKHTL